MQCLDVDHLEQFATGDLDDATRGIVEEHLTGCPDCRERLDDVQRNLDLAGSLEGLGNDPIEASPVERIGPYRIREELGRGGMGVVYLAEQDHPRRKVALKLLGPGRSSQSAKLRFEREANLLARLQHPGIAQVYDAGVSDDRAFLAMEYVQGERLDVYARRCELGLRDRVSLLIQICDAVHHAHMRGVIHRDLKPGNILVTMDTDSSSAADTHHSTSGHGDTWSAHGEPPFHIKILDFGVARAIDRQLQTLSMQTNTGQLLGTIPFMSPEQVAGDSDAVDSRADVYAIGVIGYLLLADRLPYAIEGRSIPEAARMIRDEEPTHPGTINARLRGDAETILLKALEKDTMRRYQSAAELGADLRRFLKNEPILARPPSTWYQLRKFARRNRTLTVATAVAAVMLISGAAVSTALALRAMRAEKAANENAAEATLEAAKYEAVNEFLNDMLASVDPDVSPGEPDISVRQIIERTVEELDSGQLNTRPEVEISVRTTIGNVYRALAAFEPAEQQIRKALALARETYEGDHEDHATAMHKLSRIMEDTGRLEEADRWCADALAMRRRLFDSPHEAISTSMNNLGWIRVTRGMTEEGERLLEQSLEMRRSLHGGDHETIASSLNNLAAVAYQTGRYDRAESLYRESLDMDRRVRGEFHPNIAITMSNLSALLSSTGRLEEAKRLLADALQMQSAIYGENHPNNGTMLNNLARIQAAQGRYEEAEATYRRAIELERTARGSHDPRLALVLANLGAMLVRIERIDDAAPLLRESLEINRTAHGDDHISTLRSAYYLAGLHQHSGANEKAIELLKDVAFRAESVFGPEHPDLGMIFYRYGECLHAAGQNAEAEPVLLNAHKLLVAAKRPEANVASQLLAEVYTQLEKTELAAQWRAR